jgi:class 3 adenylate cyclase
MSGEEREVTVLFGDLAGFTKISESLGGAMTVATLNRYMKTLAGALVEHGAYLNKFLGDGVMAFWSAFTPDVGQAAHACRAAVACQDMVARLNAQPAAKGVPALGLRIGVATGRVVVGDCGAPPALNDYTVIGDAVNLASRLESASKQFGTSNLIDARTREQLGPNDVAVRPIGLVVVVGQTRPVNVFEVLPCDGQDELIALSAGVVETFARRDRDACGKALEAFAARFGETPFVETYREALGEADLDGVLRLKEK